MSAVVPPVIPDGPPAPQRSVRVTFAAMMDAWLRWFLAAVPLFNSATKATSDNAQLAADSATQAVEAASIAQEVVGAAGWVSGQVYAQFACAISLVNGRTYRKFTPASASAVDPANDRDNWMLPGSTSIFGSSTLAQAHTLGLYFN